MDSELISNLLPYSILGIVAIILLLGGAYIDTFLPHLLLKLKQRKKSDNKFNSTAIDELDELTAFLQHSLNHNGWAHRTSIIISAFNRLANVGRILVDQGELQVERFLGLSLIQISEDSLKMPTGRDRLTHLTWCLEELI
jgi:hypothetical protein